MDTKDISYPDISLKYRRGDLIVKEGDYGISIYKVIKGHVRVVQEQGETEVVLATLGPGEIFGEMALLNKATGTRSASVRAMDEVQLQVIHPASLSKEYAGMSPILRYITNQTLNLLLQLNTMYVQLLKEKALDKAQALKEPDNTKRNYYRKRLNSFCIYKPIHGAGKIRLDGRLTDISVGGIGMDVSVMNALNVSHEPGDEFEIQTTLPNGRDINLVGKILTVSKMSNAPKRLQLGVQFTKLNGEDAKAVKFFMMS